MKARTRWLNIILVLALLLPGASYSTAAARPEIADAPASQAIFSADEPTFPNVPAALSSTPEWTWQNPLPQGHTLNAVWGSGPNDVYAVGNYGTILRYDGSQWYVMDSGTTRRLSGVWGSSSTNVFAVGDEGIILHYDGAAWSAMSSGTSVNLNDVWGTSESNVFAVGRYGVIRRYDGTTWRAMNSNTTEALYAVWGNAANNVFVVGNNGTIRRYDGSVWRSMSSGTTSALSGVWGSSGDDVYATGFFDILHYDGNTWSIIDCTADGQWICIGSYSVWGTRPSDVYVVGNDGRGMYGAALHYDGNVLSKVTTDQAAELYGVWGSGSNDIFAVGQWGTILHYDGSIWYHMNDSITQFAWDSFSGIWGRTPDDIFAVGGGAGMGHTPFTITRYDGTKWTGTTTSSLHWLSGVWGSDEEVFTVGSDGDYSYYEGVIVHSTDGGWSVMDIGTLPWVSLNGVWGSSSRDVFAVGSSGTILHYDGTVWRTMNSGTNNGLSAVWGSGPNDVFAVGSSGAILHYDGTVWRTMNSGTSNGLSAVWGSGPNDVFAVGSSGTILHYDGMVWRTMNSGTSNGLSAVWGSGPNDVFAVGEGGTILHYGRDPEGTINGRVSSTIGNTGLSDVVVAARTYSTTTDLNGDYTLVVSPGVYSVKATPNAGMDYYANQRSFITVYDGETVTVDLKLTPITSDTVNTLILTNLQRMKDIGFDGITVDELEAKLSELKATHPDRTNMTAAFVDFGAGVSPDIDAAYTAWDGNEGDVLKTNALVDSIDAYIENLKLNDYPNLKYLIIVGSHEVIPMKARAADSREENEWAENALPLKAAYLYEIYRSTENGASGFYFTDSQYGDLSYVRNFLGYGSDDELVPELAVGRLVETPRQIADLVDVYINANGSLSAENMLVVTSRDYLDSGSLVARYMGSGADTELIQDQFLSQLIPPKLEANHDIVYMGMHGNYYLMETYKGESAFVAGVSESQGSIDDISGDLTNAVIAASGCHVGVNLGNQLYHAPETTSTTWSDFPEEFAKKKVGVYIASTGYSIISRGSPPIKSESLMANFLRGLLHEPDYTVGDAYRAAVRDYVKWLWPWWDPDDRRVLAVATLYGIPNYRLSVTPSSPAADYTGINGGSEPTWGALLRAGAVLESIDISITDWDLSDEGIVTLPHVSYLSSIGNPLLPVITIEKVIPTGTGVLGITWDVEGSSYIDVENQVPLSEIVTLDSNGEVISETGTFTHTGFFPATMVFTRTMAIGDEGTSLNLQIMPVQYDQGTHTTRVWTHLSFDVEYDVAASIDSDGDGLPDYWEKAYGLDPLNDSGDNGPDGDIDGDGLSNIAEYHYTTNPRKADTDDDGSPDRIEILLGTDPNNPFSRAKIIFLPLVTRS